MADLQSLFLLWRGTKWQRARWRQVAAMTEPSFSRWSMAPGKAAPARGVCVTMLSRATSLHSFIRLHAQLPASPIAADEHPLLLALLVHITRRHDLLGRHL